MIAHSVTQIANGTRRVRCMFGQIKTQEGFLYHTENLPSEGARLSIGSGVSIAIEPGEDVGAGKPFGRGRGFCSSFPSMYLARVARGAAAAFRPRFVARKGRFLNARFERVFWWARRRVRLSVMAALSLCAREMTWQRRT
jgi:hypothetical protein